MADGAAYDRAYYEARGQRGGRIALWFYYRIARRYVKSGTVLDYGCGSGHFLKYFEQKRYETYGYDISAHAVDMAKENIEAGHLFNDTKELPGNRFDLICAIHCLEHINEPLKTLEFIRSLLKPRGVLMFVVPNISGIGHTLKKHNWIGYGDPAHVSLLPAEKWTELSGQAGLRLLKTGTDGLWDVPYLRGVPMFLQRLVFYPGPALQVLFGRLIVPVRWGESLVVIAQRPPDIVT